MRTVGGVLATDLVQLHQVSAHMLVSVTKDKSRLAVVATPAETKATDDIMTAFKISLLQLEGFWGVELIKRVHSDRESAIRGQRMAAYLAASWMWQT